MTVSTSFAHLYSTGPKYDTTCILHIHYMYTTCTVTGPKVQRSAPQAAVRHPISPTGDGLRGAGENTNDYLLPTTYYPPVSICYLLMANYTLLLATHYSLLATRYSLLTTHYLLLIIHYSLLTTHYSLLTTHCPTAHYPTAHCSLLTTHHSPLTSHYTHSTH